MYNNNVTLSSLVRVTDISTVNLSGDNTNNSRFSNGTSFMFLIIITNNHFSTEAYCAQYYQLTITYARNG